MRSQRRAYCCRGRSWRAMPRRWPKGKTSAQRTGGPHARKPGCWIPPARNLASIFLSFTPNEQIDSKSIPIVSDTSLPARIAFNRTTPFICRQNMLQPYSVGRRPCRYHHGAWAGTSYSNIMCYWTMHCALLNCPEVIANQVVALTLCLLGLCCAGHSRTRGGCQSDPDSDGRL